MLHGVEGLDFSPGFFSLPGHGAGAHGAGGGHSPAGTVRTPERGVHGGGSSPEGPFVPRSGAVPRRGPFTGGSPRARGGGAAHGEPRPRSRRRSRSIRRRRQPERGGSSAPHPPWAAGSGTAAASRCRGRGFTPCARGAGTPPRPAWGRGVVPLLASEAGLAERSRDAALAPEQVRAGGK